MGQGSRETVVCRGVVKMQKLGGPLEQVGRKIARLIVNPAGSEVQGYLLPGSADLDRTKAVQYLLHLF